MPNMPNFNEIFSRPRREPLPANPDPDPDSDVPLRLAGFGGLHWYQITTNLKNLKIHGSRNTPRILVVSLEQPGAPRSFILLNYSQTMQLINGLRILANEIFGRDLSAAQGLPPTGHGEGEA
jgi:hypothetical protein